ncbi:MAG: bacillithiol biosynthesis BshC, partial [Acidobacteriales bacterium]
MPSSCVPHTSLPGASRLFADFAYHFDRVRRFYDFAPGESASYASAAAAVEYPGERRAELVEALRELNPGHPSLDLLARPGTCVVATGQQVGLLFGPAYTIYKALTAAKLAQQLTANGIPAVPVFWLATEDHDLQEVDHCWVFDSAHRAARIDAGGALGSQGPVGRIPVGENPAAVLRGALEGLPFAGEVTAAAEQAYAPGRTFGEAFRALFQKLLSSYGLLCLDPLQPAVRQLAAPLLSQAAGDSGELVRLVLDRNRELVAAGYHAQVHVDDDSSLLFLLDGGDRQALRSQGDGFVAGGRTFSLGELRDRAADLSPNALLRPVVQDYLMPTVACVMGPAELAYMAQAQVIYRALL